MTFHEEIIEKKNLEKVSEDLTRPDDAKWVFGSGETDLNGRNSLKIFNRFPAISNKFRKFESSQESLRKSLIIFRKP